jgi:hypothetical protein
VSTDTFGNTLAKIITARALKSILNSSFMRMDLDGLCYDFYKFKSKYSDMLLLVLFEKCH